MHYGVRWRVAGLLFAVALFNYFDRTAISIASPAIKAQLGLSNEQLGIVFSSFFLGYALFNFIGGWAADRFGPNRTLLFSIIAWSLCCGLTAAAQGFASLLVIRVLFGAAEGPFGAASAKLVNQCFPKREVSSAIAFGASGTPVGVIFAGPVMAALILGEGWRVSLMLVGACGILFAVVWSRYGSAWSRLAREALPATPMSASVPPAPSSAAVSDASQARGSAKKRSRLLSNPIIVANAAAYFAYTYLLSLYLSWMPIFFMSRYHLDLRAAAFGSSAPWIMAFAGLWAGGLLSDAIFRSSGRLLPSRRIPQVAGLAMAALGTAFLADVPTVGGAIAIASVSLFALYVTGTSYWAVVQDVVPAASVGRASGFTHLIANLGGLVGPALTGAIVQHTDSFRLAWLVAAGLCGLALAGVVIVARMSPVPAAVASAAGQGVSAK